MEDISRRDGAADVGSHKLKPWRGHVWLHPKKHRDAAFYATVSELIDLYTRPLHGSEMVLAVDEKTSLQPRPRQHRLDRPSRRTCPTSASTSTSALALNLCAAFDTRSGKVYGQCYDRKRPQECIAFLEQLDQEIAEHIRRFISCVTTSVHIMAKRSRTMVSPSIRDLSSTFTPVHGSWMNQVEQWFSILPRTAVAESSISISTDYLRVKLGQYFTA